MGWFQRFFVKVRQLETAQNNHSPEMIPMIEMRHS
jgi:hypothetical protein